MDWIFWLKLLHTLIVFLVFAGLAHIIYCALLNKRGLLLWLSFALYLVIALAYVANGECLITTWVRQLAGHAGEADIFLPNWLAFKIVPASILLMSLGCLLHCKNYLWPSAANKKNQSGANQ